MLVGRSTSPTHQDDCREVSELFRKLGGSGHVIDNDLSHKRGNTFAALNVGMYCGGGPPEPYNRNPRRHKKKVEKILNNAAVRRLAEEQSSELPHYLRALQD